MSWELDDKFQDGPGQQAPAGPDAYAPATEIFRPCSGGSLFQLHEIRRGEACQHPVGDRDGVTDSGKSSSVLALPFVAHFVPPVFVSP